MGDGDGWARCAKGHQHWGRNGAAGMLIFHRHPEEGTHVLLQQRAWWCSGALTWCLFGGGRHGGEDAVSAALRETTEECTLDTASLRLHGMTVDDHGGWSYTTVIASAAQMPEVLPASSETRRALWLPLEKVDGLRLFQPFALAWPMLATMMSRLVLVVDAANVVGSRADGWWRDRAGAAARLRDELASLAARGVTGLPEDVVGHDTSFPEIVMVVEGAARSVAGTQVPGVRMVAAPGSGDDAIVDLVGAPEPDTVYLVVTADRGLRERVTAAGARTVGPGWLLSRLAAG
ncbi:ADP-ribose pyrophosphatase YjhB, NUDIX family [Thermomonospora echinospora]|uniref:ADP-ribose pyrophosphatase YjhB, NUDIX family n=1 Tax=Thermomonospora echinospora TaxID=1992 RepID=A0A1H5UYX8_9ACTN|nr:NUDIX hydrolase [Thermomonospora echinospora]SEF80295.1 ADP-ribose pyrophosphatase YjhB, NUDIX family [Thermomonospora echinospora]